jgi:hypothetical protein
MKELHTKPKLLKFRDFDVVQLELTEDEYKIISVLLEDGSLLSDFKDSDHLKMKNRDGEPINDKYLAALTEHQLKASFQLLPATEDSSSILLIPFDLVDVVTAEINEAKESDYYLNNVKKIENKTFENLTNRLSDLIETDFHETGESFIFEVR